MKTKVKPTKEEITYKVLLVVAFAVIACYFVPQAIRTLDPNWLFGFYLFLPFIVWKQRASYAASGKLFWLGIRGLATLILHHPRHTAFVIVITSVMLVIGITVLTGEEFQFLSLGSRITAICVLGLGSLIGSITWSVRFIPNKE